jgi:hypothetical protein
MQVWVADTKGPYVWAAVQLSAWPVFDPTYFFYEEND